MKVVFCRSSIWVLAASGMCAAVPAQTAGSVAGDRAALVALYEATDGPNWSRNDNWLSARPLSEWYRVETDGGGRVIRLDLAFNGLRGRLPASLADLTELRSLYLGGNHLTGAIPPEFGSFRNLEVMHFQRNRLTGRIPPQLGDIATLRLLILGENFLVGSIPAALSNAAELRSLQLDENDLTGPIPPELANLRGLEFLGLTANSLSGPVPAALGDLRYLRWLELGFNPGLSGPLPRGLVDALGALGLERVDLHATGVCVPGDARLRSKLSGIDFDSSGLDCGAAPARTPVVDIAVFYTQAARREAGGVSGIEDVIDLMVATANQAYADSGVGLRLALVARREVAYAETGDSSLDHLGRLTEPADGHMDEVHAIRDEVGADIVHLVGLEVGSIAYLAQRASQAFSTSGVRAAPVVFVHELGHMMGLSHDRYNDCRAGICQSRGHMPYGFGYVNQQAFRPGAPPGARWRTIMAYNTQCAFEGVEFCRILLRFSDADRTFDGDLLGVPGERDSGVEGPADAVRALNEVRHSLASYRPEKPGYRIRIEPPADGDDDDGSDEADGGGPCRPDGETLCLLDSRYKVDASWRAASGDSGTATVADSKTNDAGLFWFFDAGNWELLVKVLDGCAVNGNVWVYSASTTDLGYTLRVTDTATGTVKVYANQPGVRAAAITDAEAFPGGCQPGA